MLCFVQAASEESKRSHNVLLSVIVFLSSRRYLQGHVAKTHRNPNFCPASVEFSPKISASTHFIVRGSSSKFLSLLRSQHQVSHHISTIVAARRHNRPAQRKHRQCKLTWHLLSSSLPYPIGLSTGSLVNNRKQSSPEQTTAKCSASSTPTNSAKSLWVDPTLHSPFSIIQTDDFAASIDFALPVSIERNGAIPELEQYIARIWERPSAVTLGTDQLHGSPPNYHEGYLHKFDPTLVFENPNW